MAREACRNYTQYLTSLLGILRPLLVSMSIGGQLKGYGRDGVQRRDINGEKSSHALDKPVAERSLIAQNPASGRLVCP